MPDSDPPDPALPRHSTKEKAPRSATTDRVFSLRYLFTGVTGLCVVMALLANESLGVAMATSWCLLGYFAIAKLSEWMSRSAAQIILSAWQQRRLSMLTALYRGVPPLALLTTLVFVNIVVGNHVRLESVAKAKLAVTWGWALVPFFWLISFRMTKHRPE